MTRRKLLGRTIRAIVVTFWVMFISFALIRITPGDPVATRLGAEADPARVASLRAELGLDKDPFTQFVINLYNLTKGDLGTSLVTGVEVSQIVKVSFPVTLSYIALSFLGAFLISIPIGTIIGWWNKAPLVYTFRAVTSIIIATPNFFIAMIGILIFSVQRDWAPVFGYEGGFPGNLKYLWLPAAINTLILTAIISRVLLASVVDTKNEEFVETGIIRGVRPSRFFTFYILKPSLAPTVVLISYMMGASLGATVILETVFSLPGIGRELVQAVLSADYPVVQGVLLFFGIITVTLSFLGDLAAYALDRRVKI